TFPLALADKLVGAVPLLEVGYPRPHAGKLNRQAPNDAAEPLDLFFHAFQGQLTFFGHLNPPFYTWFLPIPQYIAFRNSNEVLRIAPESAGPRISGPRASWQSSSSVCCDAYWPAAARACLIVELWRWQVDIPARL